MKTDDVQKAYEFVADHAPLSVRTFTGHYEMSGLMKLVLMPDTAPPAQFIVGNEDGMEFERVIKSMSEATGSDD